MSGTVRSLVTEVRFVLAGFKQAEQAFRTLQARAQQVGDIRFRATGVQQVESTIARLRDAARQAVPVPMRGAGGPAPAVARAPVAVRAPTAPTPVGVAPMAAVRIPGVEAARASLDGLRVMAQAASAAVASIAASFSIGKLIEAGDAATRHMNQLRAELEGTGVATDAIYERLYAMGRVTGVSVDAGVQAFTRMNNSVRDTGASTEQVLQVIQGIQKAGAVSGASAGDVGEVLRQLGQSFGSGKLNGDELRILMERMGPLGREIAKEMGVAAGQLKEMGSKGKLTTEKVFPALLKAVQGFEDKFGRLNLTLDRARGISATVFNRFLADLDHAIDLTPTLAAGLVKITEWIDGLRIKLPVVRRFINDLGGIKSVLEAVAIAAGVATAAFFRFGLSLIVPGAVALGIAGIAVALQDLWRWVQGRPSLMGDFFGDFEPVRQQAVAALDAVAVKLRELRDEAVAGLGFASTGEMFADIERRFVAFADTTRREWEAVRAAFTSDAALGTLADTFSGLARSAESMWAIVGPIIRGLVGGPSEMAKEWANIRAAIGDPLKAVGAFFDDVWQRATNVYTRIGELAEKLRGFLASVGLMTIPKGETVSREPFGPPAAAGAAPAGPRASPPRAAPAPMNDLGLPGYNPVSFMPQDLSGRMFRSQAGNTNTASQTNAITQHIKVTATGSSGAEIAAAAQSGVSRANRDAFGASDAFARNLGFDMSRTELAAA